ncbi:sensor histidine kinase [Haloarchaeobius amylolyticus]|uniref:sensor histidine kinase n=1 Tax=Haloarchaeobius amylolyticus TaxID=1198296 RepID=UPI002271024F|nr:PAS domain-containing sensor histidine kinase [Haloarchaeobius amylolyticus]
MGESEATSSAVVLQTLVENLPYGVLVEDESRTVVVANQALCEVLDIDQPPDELVGRDCARAARDAADTFADDEPFLSRLDDVLERREPVHGEALELDDGRIVERTYVPYELPDGEANLWLYRDVTDQRTRERELERKNERLEQFASVLSHDIRNPLSVATASIEMAAEEHDSEHLTVAAESLDRIDSLTSQLLTLARDGRRSEEMAPVPLSHVVDEAWRNVETAEATLVNDAEGRVEADWGRLAQFFENLLNNAIEHGGADVRVQVASTTDGFTVTDDGAGLDDAETDRLFETGYSTKEGGTGLGLSIVEDIATAHGWDIAVESPSDAGLSIEVTGVTYLA